MRLAGSKFIGAWITMPDQSNWELGIINLELDTTGLTIIRIFQDSSQDEQQFRGAEESCA